jgi:hypothetical protein
MITWGMSPSVTTTRDVVDFLLFPLIVALTISMLTFVVWIVRKLQDHSEALAVILHEMNPKDAPSLSSQLAGLRQDVAVMKSQPSNHGNP